MAQRRRSSGASLAAPGKTLVNLASLESLMHGDRIESLLAFIQGVQQVRPNRFKHRKSYLTCTNTNEVRPRTDEVRPNRLNNRKSYEHRRGSRPNRFNHRKSHLTCTNTDAARFFCCLP